LFGHRSEKIIKNYLFTIPQHYSFGVGDYCFGFCLTCLILPLDIY